MSKKISRPSEEELLRKVLESMGIEEYDPLLITALCEYTRRFTTELLCDAIDLSTHVQREVMTADDMKLAIKLSDTNITNSLSFEESQKNLSIAQKSVNSKDILHGLDKEAVLIRYPRHTSESFSQRCFTYVPGSEAYPEVTHTNEIDSHRNEPKTTKNQPDPSDEYKPVSMQLKAVVKRKYNELEVSGDLNNTDMET